jgi:LexA-binding, inner membrane-associated putative hydrolase
VSNGPTHRVLGLYGGAVLGLAAGWPLWQTAASAVIASATAHGPTSPDGDQSWLAWLGRHRGVTHWWGWPALLATFAPLAGPGGWPLYSLAVGVAVGHLLGDLVWGEPGIPLLPFDPWWHVGLCLPNDGRRKIRSRDWTGEVREATIRVGRAERVARRVLQWGLVPLGAWVTLSPVILPALAATARSSA